MDPKLQAMFDHLADAHDSIVAALETRSEREMRCNPELLHLFEMAETLAPNVARRSSGEKS